MNKTTDFPRIFRGGCAPSPPDSVVEAAAQAANTPTAPNGLTPGQIFVAVLRQRIAEIQAEIAGKQGELGGLNIALNTYLDNHPENN
jgi:hypothetical protein